MNFSGNFLFKVVGWDSCDEPAHEYTQYCIIAANSFKEAAEYIEGYFGDEIISLECEILEHSKLITISEDEWRRQKEEG